MTTPVFIIGPLQRQWRDALKSKDYVHGTGYLCFNRPSGELSHCCLGVLCEILEVPKKISSSSVIKFDGCDQTAPDTVWQRIKLRSEMGEIRGGLAIGNGLFLSLAEVNDHASTTSYVPIIKIIDETPELIFTEPA